ILAVLIPVLLRRFFAADLASAASTEPGGIEPSEPLLHPRVSLSLDDEDAPATSARDGSARIGAGMGMGGVGVGTGRGSAYLDDAEYEGGRNGGGAGANGSARASGRPMLKPGGGSADKVSRVLGVQVR
ncbi:hypothetical protein JCM11251_004054, partial [Rhodosporidiobolus azoricus]